MNIRKSVLLGALLACGTAMAATTATPAAEGHAAVSPRHFHHSEMMENMSFIHAIHQLNLTPEQRTTIQGYLDTARQQAKENAASRVDMSVLANPGDPNYAAAVAAAKSNAANRIQAMSDLDVQVYGVLTSEQKSKLPQELADMSAKRAQHHTDGKSHRAPTPTTTG